MAPQYELAVILRAMNRPETAGVLKRTAEAIMSRGGYIEKLENLGLRQLPYAMRCHGQKHRQGHYFLMHFHSPPTIIDDLKEHYHRDVDIIKPNIFLEDDKKEEPPECTLNEEIKPPAYRKDLLSSFRK